MRHTVYTSQSYEDDNVFAERMLLATDTIIPAMVAQTVSTMWCWVVKDRHQADVLMALHEGGWTNGVRFAQGGLHSLTPESKEVALYDDIQTSIDSDDRITPDFLEIVQAYYKEQTSPYAMCWQPIKQHYSTKQLHKHKKTYRADHASMFYSVYNPDEHAHVFAITHTKLHTLMPVTVASEQEKCVLVVHGKNKYNTIEKEDVLLHQRVNN